MLVVKQHQNENEFINKSDFTMQGIPFILLRAMYALFVFVKMYLSILIIFVNVF